MVFIGGMISSAYPPLELPKITRPVRGLGEPFKAIKEYFFDKGVNFGEKMMVLGAYICMVTLLSCLILYLTGIRPL